MDHLDERTRQRTALKALKETQIFVKGTDGRTRTIDINPEADVEELYGKISAKFDIPEKHIRVNYAAKQLVRGRKVRDYGIKKESTLHLSLRLHGGF